MTSLWWRSWHGAPTDSKWLAIAKRACVAPGMVSAFAWALFDHASQQDGARGCVEGFDIESYAAFSGFSEEDITAIWKAFDEKGMIENGKLCSWEKRQPQREREDHSTERVRKHRNAKKHHETPGNPILDKIRLDNKDTGNVIPIEVPKRKKPARGLPDDWRPSLESTQKAQKLGLTPREIATQADKFRNHARQNDRTAVRWDAAFDNWCISTAERLGREPEEKRETFPAAPGSPEFNAWKAHYTDNGQKWFISQLKTRELEGRDWHFPSRWPPGMRTADTS